MPFQVVLVLPTPPPSLLNPLPPDSPQTPCQAPHTPLRRRGTTPKKERGEGTTGEGRRGGREGAIAAATLVVLLVGGPYVYIHFIESKTPAPLALTSTFATSEPGGTTGSTQGTVKADGTWKVTGSSVVGYRVGEVLFGQSHTATGRTNAITGSIAINGTTVASGSFTVDMTTLTSDDSRRDDQFNGRIMETSTYPTATFALTQPIELGAIPAAGVQRTMQAKGTLTLHGVTKTVAFTVNAQHVGSTIQVAGSIPITFADWNISNPSFAPLVTTEDHGVLEFALDFDHA